MIVFYARNYLLLCFHIYIMGSGALLRAILGSNLTLFILHFES